MTKIKDKNVQSVSRPYLQFYFGTQIIGNIIMWYFIGCLSQTVSNFMVCQATLRF